LDPIFFADGTPVPEATRRIFDAMNEVHQRVAQFGDGAVMDASLAVDGTALSSQASRS
jgi:hypothetical protein